MEELKDVVLHVYQLTEIGAEQGNNNDINDGNCNRDILKSTTSWFTRTLLPAVGMGAYHTSLGVDGFRYTFTANYGIVKCYSHVELTGLPPNAVFQESIPLGGCSYRSKGEITELVKKLSEEFFTPSSYHLVHRNCNHFTETFATALILRDQLAEPDVKRLKTYPHWVNRLANTGQMVVSKGGDDVVTCNPVEEARKAVGADRKVGWSLQSNQQKKSANTSSSSQTKKELTPAQKAALAKIRGY